MSDPVLGRLVGADEERDAIHIALITAIAGEELTPGDHVKVVDGKATKGWRYEDAVGIVDPFLMDSVFEGERFWLVLYPGTVTGMRHEWQHPKFPLRSRDDDRGLSERWLRQNAALYRFDYDELIEAVIKADGYCFGDDDGPDWARSIDFWRHMENVTGKQFDEKHRSNMFWRCSC